MYHITPHKLIYHLNNSVLTLNLWGHLCAVTKAQRGNVDNSSVCVLCLLKTWRFLDPEDSMCVRMQPRDLAIFEEFLVPSSSKLHTEQNGRGSTLPQLGTLTCAFWPSYPGTMWTRSSSQSRKWPVNRYFSCSRKLYFPSAHGLDLVLVDLLWLALNQIILRFQS